MTLDYTRTIYKNLDTEFKNAQASGVLISSIQNAMTSFVILRLACEYEENIRGIMHEAWISQIIGENKKLEYLIDNVVLKKTKSSKYNAIKQNFSDVGLIIPNIQELLTEERKQNHYKRIFGSNDSNIENNIRDQIAHNTDFDFSKLPSWNEIPEYITVCETVLSALQENIIFKE